LILLKFKFYQLRTFLVAWRVAPKVSCELRLLVFLHLASGITWNWLCNCVWKTKPSRHIAVRPEQN